MEQIDRIREFLGPEEVLAQLAEEAAELSQAALKARRALSGVNPTPVPLDKAIERLWDELADVNVCLMVLKLENCGPGLDVRVAYKLARWVKRLEEGSKSDKGEAAKI